MKLAHEIILNAPVDRVWKIVAHDFDRVGDWASGIQQSTADTTLIAPEGATVGGRVCHVPGMGELHEQFTAYDEARKTFTYQATGMPFFIVGAYNTWYVERIDALTSRVRFQAEFHLMPVIGWVMGAMMRMQMIALLRSTVEELKYYVETGNVHPRKHKLLAQAVHQRAA